MTASPLLASGQDVINDFAGGPQGGGTIEKCYSPQDFNDAIKIARSDKAQYGGAVEVIRAKQAECAANATTAPVDVKRSDGGVSPLIIIGAGLLVIAVAASALVARRRRHDQQFDEIDPPPNGDGA